MTISDQMDHPDEPLMELEELIETWGTSDVMHAMARVLHARGDEQQAAVAHAYHDAANKIAEAAWLLQGIEA